MRSASGHYSLTLLRVGDHLREGTTISRTVVQADSGLTRSEAAKAMVARYDIATSEGADSLLEQAFRLGDDLADTELSEIRTDLPNRVLVIRYEP